MATFSKHFLSNSTNGCGIIVNSVSGGTAGTAGTIHQCNSGTSSKDEVWMYAYNNGTANVYLSLEWGTSSCPRTMTIPYKVGLVPIIPGLPIQDSFIIQAFASTADVIVIDGFINRITD